MLRTRSLFINCLFWPSSFPIGKFSAKMRSRSVRHNCLRPATVLITGAYQDRTSLWLRERPITSGRGHPRVGWDGKTAAFKDSSELACNRGNASTLHRRRGGKYQYRGCEYSLYDRSGTNGPPPDGFQNTHTRRILAGDRRCGLDKVIRADG